MPDRLRITTWNINSIRLRMDLVCKFLSTYQPDILCLQETKSLEELIDIKPLIDHGYPNCLIRGQKSYNGVAIISRHPLKELARNDFINREEARHISATLPNGITIENFYVPAGGDIPDRSVNPKFGDKLDFLEGMKNWYQQFPPSKTILVGDLNIAPLEEDVWSHRQLLNVVSHTPIEVNRLNDLQRSGGWIDAVRHLEPEGKLYSWWSYRARNWELSDRGRRLDHIWVSNDLKSMIKGYKIYKEIRGWERPSDHVPVLTELLI